MKKKFLKIIVPVLCASFLLAGCSSDSGDSEGSEISVSSAESEQNAGNPQSQYAVSSEKLPAASDIMPKMMTSLSYGGFVPEEYSVDIQEEARYDVVALKGRWCVEGSAASDEPAQATDTLIKAQFASDDSEVSITEMTSFPDTIVFGLNSSGYSSDTLLDIYVYAMNYLIADFSYRNQDNQSFTAVVPFAIDGNTLALGFYDASGEDDAALAQEIDYLMDWTGWKLTLTYGDESVTYVPTVILSDADDGVVMTGGSIISGYEGIDGITEVDPGEGTVVIDGKSRKATFEFREDGTATIQVRRGETYELSFRYSGDTLTLIDGDHVALYGTMYEDEEE